MSYKISDAVAMRMIQIFQEALLLGVDGADLMRQVRLTVDSEDAGVLTLDPEYEVQVANTHKKYLEDAEKLKSERSSKEEVKLVFEN